MLMKGGGGAVAMLRGCNNEVPAGMPACIGQSCASRATVSMALWRSRLYIKLN